MEWDFEFHVMRKTTKQILAAALRGEEVTLTGIIVSGELDANFKMISVLFSSDRELDLLVERNERGDELFSHLRAMVRVKGLIREDDKGRRTIRVTDYKLLETDEGKPMSDQDED